MGNINNYDNTKVENQTVINHYNYQNESLSKIAIELGKLRQAILARQDNSPERAIALGTVAAAELAAKKSDATAMFQHLKSTGEWVLKVATEIGTSVAGEAIKRALNM